MLLNACAQVLLPFKMKFMKNMFAQYLFLSMWGRLWSFKQGYGNCKRTYKKVPVFLWAVTDMYWNA